MESGAGRLAVIDNLRWFSVQLGRIIKSSLAALTLLWKGAPLQNLAGSA